MTDPTTVPAVDDAAFDISTAAGRLRILWGATADPQLAMSEDEVADVQTVLDEHAAMAAELERLRSERENKPRKPVDIGTGMPATSHLEAFGQCLRDAFGAMPYHVGSSIHGKTWRDVDVRIMLDDDRFDALFPGYAAYRQRDAWWSLVCSAISELGKQRTGLPIDFQVQRTSYANKKFPAARNPLFVGHAEEGHRPTMVEPGKAT